MARTLRSHLERWMLWRRAGGKCQHCGEALTSQWHAHHKYPWSLTRRTSINEMQAVCALCNLKMGDKMDFYDEKALRLGQRLACTTCLRRIGELETHTALVIATRYGKSDLQRIITMVAIKLGLACCGVSLNPTDFLCEQIVDKDKWSAMCERTKLQATPVFARISASVMNPTANNENFLSVSMQFFQHNLKYWKDWARDERRRTGKPVILFVDECHTNATNNKWGAAVTEWQQYTGCHVVLLTATPDRSDCDQIPGFKYDLVDAEDVIVYKNRPGSAPEKIRIDKFGGVKGVLTLKADYTVTFKQAWTEEVLCHVEPNWFDVNLDEIDGSLNATERMLSELTVDKDIRRALNRSIRHPVVIRRGCEMTLRRLRSFRAVDPACAAIVFCGNDNDQSDAAYNQHAAQIKRDINNIDPSLKVVIATSANDGRNELTAFRDGVGDVLVVKQMAGLGIDISRLKVGLDLSPIRTNAAVIQRMMRVATPHQLPNRPQQMLVCAWVTPYDMLSTAIYQSVIAANGGSATTMDLDLLASYEKDREQSPQPRTDYVPTGTRGVGASDTRGNTATETDLDLYARTVLDLVPEIGAFISQPELVQRQKIRTAQANSNTTKPQDTRAQVQQLRDDINAYWKQVVNSRMSKPYDRNKYEQLSKEIWGLAMEACGIERDYKLKQINDLAQLTKLRDVFIEMLRK